MLDDSRSSRFDQARDELGLPPLNLECVDAHGLRMRLDGPQLRFNDVIESSATFRLDRPDDRGIASPWLRYALIRHVEHKAIHASPREAYNTIRLNTLWLRKTEAWPDLMAADSYEEFKTALCRAMSQARWLLDDRGVLYNFARIREFYCWCADHIAELGFDPEYAFKLEQLRIPGNEKGVAVMTEDPRQGPLETAEQMVLLQALMADESMRYEHIRERCALWLALAFGRNPGNYALLREVDLKCMVRETAEHISEFELAIPRIKKRVPPRREFTTTYVVTELADLLQLLIDANSERGEGPTIAALRPLFLRDQVLRTRLGTDLREWAWHMRSHEITELVQQCVQRLGVVSPRTGQRLCITMRRLRYTFATNLVRQGVTPYQLADALDHTDTQHVMVYFNTRSSIVESLDAASGPTEPIFGLFRGTVAKKRSQAINADRPDKSIRIMPEAQQGSKLELGVCGNHEQCNLRPPFSCYGCVKFQPYVDSLPVHVLAYDYLMRKREGMRTDVTCDRALVTQIDTVIAACADVIKLVRMGAANDETP